MEKPSLPRETEASPEALESDAESRDPDTDTQRLSLLAACATFDFLREELFRLFRDVRDGKSENAKKLAPSITELGRALGTMLREYDKLEEHRGRNGVHLHEQTLDLGAARDEIGRRLARLRAAGRAGEVSERTDGE